MSKKRAREKKNKSTSTSTSSRKRRRKNATNAKKYAFDPTIAMIATIALSLLHAINPTIATSTGRRERKLDNGKNFRDYRIDPKDFLANPWKFGLKILEELAELGGNSRRFKGNVNNRVFRCVTCGHSDYEDGMIVYAIFIQEHVADRPYVNRITWVCDYGMRILREYDCRIRSKKLPNAKTAYARVNIPIEGAGEGGTRKEVCVHQLLFNKKYGRGPFRVTDHIENSDEATNGLNNLLANVRCGAPDGTRRLNNSNRSTRKNNTSGHTGVRDRKGVNEGGREENGDFGFWVVQYNELDEVSKQTKKKSESKSFRRDYGDEVHKRETFEEACKFQEEKEREYVADLEEYYEPIRALHDRWFSVDRDTQDVFRSFERHWHSLRPSILELTRSSK